MEQSAELAALNAEAEMPIEELMALYGRDGDVTSDDDKMSVDLPSGELQPPRRAMP